ncbi:UDP-glucose/GDP-mannose dehydrogenase family protein [Cereibacter azotoformans]|uniref:UDP-glucose 6-dehydrogenase n=5 Tax=Cereibacter TaxID=1653176 RepID=A4WQ21_CERS5|nr:UDP-glucose/GDP-mannose dehydrogenase family protein [Cereibacter azotoformans]AXQ92803.1 UDP-glucose/GDP-mannose dehydrogenase family protein [Cereibacter sphaeroides]MBO4169581.1 UDP-glucose/GDP-mannose dehydrogenase family protein [Cereibacter azotoformans]UIJ31087.1 UDP-glucose/GDP-mannose dehydrogenase family protein [Cereibacter azotoformans]ULB08886.1 UDP-glucose/GDP-mannose dehydrogenase family protein [Cereibacter azotoformans]
MKIAMIGTGYVGLVSGVCFSDFGHEVVCVDKDPAKIAKLKDGKVPIFEPGLEALMTRNVAAGRLSFTLDLAEAMRDAEAVFIAVGTPTRRGDGHADLTYVMAAAEEIAHTLRHYAVVVTKSTVPIGTNRKVAEVIRTANPAADFDVASNPEFLREGAAIDDFMRPDRVVVGLESERARKIMADIYRPLFLRDFPVVFTGLESAEMIKYAANAFLATKITFINEIAALCERVGADIKAVSKGMGLDGRIGNKFLHAGPGYGGSCFPKDTKALARMGQDHASPIQIVETVIKVNDEIKRRMIEKIEDLCEGSCRDKVITVLGVTFKPNTDDMRDAPSLTIVPALIGAGAKVRVVDPEGRREGEHLLPGVRWMDDAYAAAEGASALVILTEWNEFRALDLGRLARVMAEPKMADLRNVYAPAEVTRAGFKEYVAVGRSEG